MPAAKKLFLLFASIAIVGCSSSRENAVARVGDEILTIDDLHSVVGESADVERQREYTLEWIERELLYQAALSQRLDQDSAIQANLIESEKNLLSMVYLNSAVGDDSVSVTPEEVEEYFSLNSSEFIRNDDVIRFAVYSLNTQRDAWNVRSNLSSSNFFSSASRYSQADVIPEDEIRFVPRSSLSPELQAALFDIREGGITTPLRVGDYYNLYLILEKGEAGSESSLGEVYNDVRNTLLTSRYQEQVNTVLSEVRLNSDFSYNHEYFESTEPTGTLSVSVRREEDDE